MQTKETISKRKRVAFVCSGGAAKAAAFHMGVCLALQEKGFRFVGGLKGAPLKPAPDKIDIDTYVGSSAGSLITTYLTVGFTVEQIFDAYLGRSKSSALKPMTYSTLMSVKPSLHETAESSGFSSKFRMFTAGAIDLLYRRQKLLSLSGLFSTAGIESYLRNDVLPSNSFKDYRADLSIVATQLNHSKRVVFGKNQIDPPKDDPRCLYETEISISDAVSASTALPPIFTPYGIKNRKGKLIYFFDGEIRETLSVNVAEQLNADLIISSYTHQPYHYSREIGSLTKYGITAIGIQAIYLLIERKIQSSIYVRNQKLAALESVNEYCLSKGIDDKHRKKLCAILEEQLSVNPNNRYIYIHPRPKDHEMFFGDHFSFSPKFMDQIVRVGFMSAIETLRRFNFQTK